MLRRKEVFDLEDIIRRIIEIEDKAQEIVNDARTTESNLEKRVEAEDKILAQKIREKAENRCRELRESEQKRINEKINEINKMAESRLAELQKKYSENKEKWVDDMVRHIIGE